MKIKSLGSAIGFLDLLFNCLIVFVFMFAVAFAQIDPETKRAELKTKAEIVITMTWVGTDNSDVDIWILDPAGNLISFKNKSAGLTHIDRDDTGGSGDTFTTSDGRVVKYEHNQEIVTIRGIIPGEWVINIHLYKQNHPSPSLVSVRMDDLNPKFTTPFNEKILLEKHWEEVTVFRFTLGDDGEIITTSDIPVSLLAMHPDMKARTSGEVSRGRPAQPPEDESDARSISADPNIGGPR